MTSAVLECPQTESNLSWIQDLLSDYDSNDDRSGRICPGGPSYFVDNNGITSLGDFALTDELTVLLQERLRPGQKIVMISNFRRYRQDGDVPLEYLCSHAIWILTEDQRFKVRGIHEETPIDSRFENRNTWIQTLQVAGSSIEFNYLEPHEVESKLTN